MSRSGFSAHFFCARTQKKKFHSSSEFDKISDGINQKGRAEKETDCYNEVKIRQIQSAYRQDKTLYRREEKTMKNRKTQFQKLEIAEEIGVIDKIYAGGYGNLTSKESGKIGGILAARNKAKKK